VGGTFTDLVIINEQTGKIDITKVLSTPRNPATGVEKGIRKIVEKIGIQTNSISYFAHGTTVATNAVLEHKGAKTALITTKGFRDVLEIGRQRRPSLYRFDVDRAKPLVPRNLRKEVTERILFDGIIHEPLDEGEVRKIVKELKEEGVESIAVSLLFSYCNPTHERKIKEIITEVFPEVYISLSSEILPEYREYERTSTTVLNAYVMPVMDRYLGDLTDRMRRLGVSADLLVMQSTGGTMTSEVARKMSVHTLLSGPAAGVIGATYIADLVGYKNLITVDMGGTSCDVSLVDKGEPKRTTDGKIGGYPLKIPIIDINTIGAGGGSIAWIDPGGALRVGPESAGADPGPACYGLGGEKPTVTDANAVLGYINPRYFLGGEMSLDVKASEKVISKHIAEKLGLDITEAANGIVEVANANMVRAIRVVSVERGYDPRDFVMVPFGGAGPLHASKLAEELNIPRILVPSAPGVLSAMGLLTADVRHDYVQTYHVKTCDAEPESIAELFASLEERGIETLVEEGFPVEKSIVMRYLDMRYLGQSYEITVPMTGGFTHDSLKEAEQTFHREHERIYGHSAPDEPTELVNLRVVVLGRNEKFKLPELPAAQDPVEKAMKEVRRAFFSEEGGYVECPVYDRGRLQPGHEFYGPAVVEQMESTLVINPDQRVWVDHYGNIHIEVGV